MPGDTELPMFPDAGGARGRLDAAGRLEAVTAATVGRAATLLARRQAVQQKLAQGASLSDAELQCALRWYRQLLAVTEPCGPEFRLFRREIVATTEHLQRWQEARRERS